MLFFLLINVLILMSRKNSMLNSAEHEIVNAHKYKNTKKFSFLQTKISRGCYFFSAHKCLNANNCWDFNIF